MNAIPPKPPKKAVVLGCLVILVGIGVGLGLLWFGISSLMPDEQVAAQQARPETALTAAAPAAAPQPTTRAPEATAEKIAEQVPKAPDLSSLYVVKKDDHMGAMKRTVNVLLFARQNEAILEAIARGLKASDARQYERTYVTFDVRGEPKPEGMSNWALARFDPDFGVQILGDE